MKKLLIICLSLFAFNFAAQAQLIDNHIAIETKVAEDRTYIEIIDNKLKKDVNQEFYHITWKMDGNDIDLVIPMNKVEFLKSRNRNYVYMTEKFKIKCERKFEINPRNIVVGFSSKNCF